MPDRGEFFVRDSGGQDPPVLLLHGWMFASDLNWWPVYDAVRDAGHRVIAMDHRGHGRGLRSTDPFRLVDCAHDAAGVLRELGCGPAIAVGYSMGGPIAQLLARDHREDVAGLVLCATAQDWHDRHLRLVWRTMAVTRLSLGLAPTTFWHGLLRLGGIPRGARRDWAAAELSRGSSVDLAEAGRELSRYDARPWIGELRGLPAAVVLTTRDRSVLPRKQRALAQALDAATFTVRADHMAVSSHPQRFRQALLAALEAVARDRSQTLAPATAA